jgi:hypothetical protein
MKPSSNYGLTKKIAHCKLSFEYVKDFSRSYRKSLQ